MLQAKSVALNSNNNNSDDKLLPRSYSTSTFINDGNLNLVVIFGGTNGVKLFNDFHIYDLNAKKLITNATLSSSFSFTGYSIEPRCRHVAIKMSERLIFYFGGVSCDNSLYCLERSESKFRIVKEKTKNNPPTPRFGHEAIKISPTEFLIYGGVSNTTGELLNDLHVYNMNGNYWKEIKLEEDVVGGGDALALFQQSSQAYALSSFEHDQVIFLDEENFSQLFVLTRKTQNMVSSWSLHSYPIRGMNYLIMNKSLEQRMFAVFYNDDKEELFPSPRVLTCSCFVSRLHELFVFGGMETIGEEENTPCDFRTGWKLNVKDLYDLQWEIFAINQAGGGEARNVLFPRIGCSIVPLGDSFFVFGGYDYSTNSYTNDALQIHWKNSHDPKSIVKYSNGTTSTKTDFLAYGSSNIVKNKGKFSACFVFYDGGNKTVLSHMEYSTNVDANNDKNSNVVIAFNNNNHVKEDISSAPSRNRNAIGFLFWNDGILNCVGFPPSVLLSNNNNSPPVEVVVFDSIKLKDANKPSKRINQAFGYDPLFSKTDFERTSIAEKERLDDDDDDDDAGVGDDYNSVNLMKGLLGTERIVVLGGVDLQTKQVLNDVWVGYFDELAVEVENKLTWIKMWPPSIASGVKLSNSSAAAATLVPRHSSSLTFVPCLKKFISFGGCRVNNTTTTTTASDGDFVKDSGLMFVDLIHSTVTSVKSGMLTCPKPRINHFAACSCKNGQFSGPKLVVFGGVGANNEALHDCWVLNIVSGYWSEVILHDFFVNKCVLAFDVIDNENNSMALVVTRENNKDEDDECSLYEFTI